MLIMKQIKVVCGIASHFNMDLVKSEWFVFHVSWAVRVRLRFMRLGSPISLLLSMSDKFSRRRRHQRTLLRQLAKNNPTLHRSHAPAASIGGNDAPASRNAGALPDEFPRRSVGTIQYLCVQGRLLACCYQCQINSPGITREYCLVNATTLWSPRIIPAHSIS